MNPESYRKIRNCWMRLVQVMVAVAQQFGNAGRENEARWLLNMAQQLAAALGLLGDETTATA
ncbi:hypothetical protein PN467_14450, partial [Microcystis aeruginosa CS-563/04]|nr:hypothetical protein [Microcystis aeruginosa CS-563/04]